jgi:hypothetical protein
MNINEDRKSQRTRNSSYVSERDQHDNESTITVNKYTFCLFFLNLYFKALSTKTSYKICSNDSSFNFSRIGNNKYSIKR